MLRYIVSRLFESFAVLFLVSVLAFGLMHAAPGDPVMAIYGIKVQQMKPEDRERIRENLGLNHPVSLQYVRWLGGALQGNLGCSLITGRPVAEEIRERLGATLVLALSSSLLIVLFTLGAGLAAGLYRGSWFDYLVTFISYALMCLPGFWFGLMLILVFSVTLRWLPSSGMITLGKEFTWGDFLKHLIMPALVLSFTHLGYYIRLLRGSVAAVLEKDFISALRAWGISEKKIVFKHVLRNALLPYVTYLGASVSITLGGSVVTESVFAWPGLGQLAVEAATNRDYPMIMGTILLTAALVVSGSLVADLVCAWLDPRIVLYGGKREKSSATI